jgi:hypothetical protein
MQYYLLSILLIIVTRIAFFFLCLLYYLRLIKFPTALSYHWILQLVRISGSNISILIAGESAGGNLAAAVTLKLIQLNEKTPGILLMLIDLKAIIHQLYRISTIGLNFV